MSSLANLNSRDGEQLSATTATRRWRNNSSWTMDSGLDFLLVVSFTVVCNGLLCKRGWMKDPEYTEKLYFCGILWWLRISLVLVVYSFWCPSLLYVMMWVYPCLTFSLVSWRRKWIAALVRAHLWSLILLKDQFVSQSTGQPCFA